MDFFDGVGSPGGGPNARVAADIDDLLDIILQTEGVKPEGVPPSPAFSPTFWACMAGPEELPPAADWLLPPPALPETQQEQQAQQQQQPTAQRSLREKTDWAGPAQQPHQNQQQQPHSVLLLQQAAAVTHHQQQQAETAFDFLIPSVKSIPVEGLEGLTTTFVGQVAADRRQGPKRVKPAAPPQHPQKRQRRQKTTVGPRPAVFIRRTELANQRPRVRGRFVAQPSSFVPVTQL